MTIKFNPILTKLVELNVNTLSLSGYIHNNSSSSLGGIRIYPKLNTDLYYEIEESSIVEVIESSSHFKQQTVFVREDANVHVVTKVPASEFDTANQNTGSMLSKKKLPPFTDRLTGYLLLLNAALLEMYLGTESIPGPGQSGHAGDDL